MNILYNSISDTTIMRWIIPPKVRLAWQAPFGLEIIDPPTKKKLVHVSYYNDSNLPVVAVVGRRHEDGALSFTPGLVIKFDGEEEFVTDEIQTKILMEPEFSLEEIEQAQEVMDNLQ